jgi:DNA invertase Pin-like site-specific DNA recombinase
MAMKVKLTRTAKETRQLVNEVVLQCRTLHEKYKAEWKPINDSWETVAGSAYLRLSDPKQVLVELGSMIQQLHMAIDEVITRSKSDHVNYKIGTLYIDAGISGRHEVRAEFQKLKAEIAEGHHAFVVFKEISRIARDGGIWKEFFKLCIANDCQIFVRGLPFNPNDPGAVLQLDIYSSMAEYESRVTSRRIKLSVASALENSGKFNSTKQMLGFDPSQESGRLIPGLQVPNREELKTVEWIMGVFLKFGSYQRTIEECVAHGIRQKTGAPFTRAALMTLLRNKRCIGEWEMNLQNKGKSPRVTGDSPYRHIQLPHGCIIDRELWDQVQEKIIRFRKKHREHGGGRVYLLSGLLQHEDGSTYCGSVAHGNSGEVWYYFNKSRGHRLIAEELEFQAARTVAMVIRQTKEFGEAIRRQLKFVDDTDRLLDVEIKSLNGKLLEIKEEELKEQRRLDFLLDGSDVGDDSFRRQYKERFAELRLKAGLARTRLQECEKAKEQLRTNLADRDDLVERALGVQEKMSRVNRVDLKDAYLELFDRVIVREDDAEGKITLDFILKGSTRELGDNLFMVRFIEEMVASPRNAASAPASADS